MPAFTEQQVLRYSRHIILPNIGAAGQRKLLDAKVLCVGAGGLGSPVAMYLAAAGVGTLGLLDFDRVDLTNLQRQLLHDTDDVGRPKVDSAAERIAGINPDVSVVKHDTILTSGNAFEILGQYAPRQEPSVVTIDGVGEWATSSIGAGRGNDQRGGQGTSHTAIIPGADESGQAWPSQYCVLAEDSPDAGEPASLRAWKLGG